jgi:imidazolonepropionase-like amidohydrolase
MRGAEIQPPGYRPIPLGVHALVGGKVVVKPGEAIEGGSIIIRDGLITAVGKDAAVPEDARIWDMKGTTIYAGFIDPYLVLRGTNAPVSTGDSEPIDSSTYAAGGGVNFFGVAPQKADRADAGPGYEVAKVRPQHREVLEYAPNEKSLEPLREQGFTVAVVTPERGIVRGTGALVALVDDDPNRVILKADVFQHVAFDPSRGDSRAYPGSLMGIIAAVRQSFFDAAHYAADHADYARKPQGRTPPEFNPALDALAPAVNKTMTVVFEPGSALMVDRAARIARELGLNFCLVSSGQEWRRPDLAKATGATFITPVNFSTLPKMPSEDDWTQVQLDQFRAWDWAPENPALLRQQGLEVALTTFGLSDKKKFRANLKHAVDRGFSEIDAIAGLTTIPARLCGMESKLGTVESGKLACLTVVDKESYFAEDAKVREVWIQGRPYRMPAEEAKPKKEGGETNDLQTAREPGGEKKDNKKKEELKALERTRTAHAPIEGRGAIAAPPAVLIRGATVWTCGPDGTLTNANVMMKGGKIQSVGQSSLTPGPEVVVIDGASLHVTPGLIDCHSHTAILGGVNEGSLPSSAMVRIHDVVNSESDSIYQQLAGGVTAVNLLHGSANPIGGQNCVIKMRDGDAPEELVFTVAPEGIKFALGENVKQSSAPERANARYPQTRMGVRSFIQNRFTAAQEYLKEWADYRKSGGVAPRRDLELEAIGEIIEGKRLIHCHSYRQDEILMLIRLMEGFGVKIASFQHVLEGYKVADEIARHGAGASTFSDWWAYKFEVYDAIPYNGTLMHDRGVVVSFNSDSSELARRLYSEAAKAVRYGGLSEVEALKFVTLNPAKQLHIEKYVGSLEPGKDADFAIWSRNPLDSETVCLQTWVDGKKYFDRSLSADRANKLDKERTELLEKAKKLAKLSGGGPGGGEGGGPENPGEGFFKVSLEHEFDGRDRHCLDE